MNSIVTFYSYKGGVGRTMAMANVAVLLAQRGLRVLAVDWDLEAPGLERYFGYFTVEPGKGGLLPLLRDEHKGSRGHYSPHLTRVSGSLGGESFKLDLLPSGRESDPRYATTLGRFDWEEYYRAGGGDFIESLRTRWLKEYDVTLIDSRTGLSDTGGICTIQLPDVVVAMFTANHQSLFGVRDIMRLAQEARDRLAYDRTHLRVLPVPARFALDATSREAVEWIARIALTLDEFYLDWIPSWAEARQVTDVLRVPQVDAFGFGEKLAVVEQDSPEAGRLTAVYRQIADLITQDQPDAASTLGLRDTGAKRPAPTAPAPQGYEYDVFVSHAAGSVLDEWLDAFVEALRQVLQLETGRVPIIFLDLSELRVGDAWQAKAREGVLRSRTMLAIVTPEYLASEWCRREWATFEQREVAAPKAGPLILPLLVRRPPDLPDWVSRRQFLDLTDLPLSATAYKRDLLDEPILGRLTLVARNLEGLLQSVPTFDAHWTVAEPAREAVSDLEQVVPNLGPSELSLDADAVTALLRTDDRPEAVEAGRRLLRKLRQEGDFGSVVKVAEAVLARAPREVETTRLYAQALIETGKPADASAVLAPHVKRLPKNTPEFAEATALLGRAYKDVFIGSVPRTSRAARSALSKAIDAYRQGYQANRRHNTWHGVNLIALLAAANRLRHHVPVAKEEKTLARAILKVVLKTPKSLQDRWYHATVAELYLALSDWPAVERHVGAFASDPATDAVALSSFLRQLTEIWNLESDAKHGAPMVDALRARLLNLPGGAVKVPESAARPPAIAPTPTRVLDSSVVSMGWLATGMARARAVGALRDKASLTVYGTCFLVDGREVGLKGSEPVLVAASHVVGRHGEGTRKSDKVQAVFEAMDPPLVLDLGQELWSSPPAALDAAIFRLSTLPEALEPLPVARDLPPLDDPQRLYLIGHPGGGKLQMSINDNELLDHDGPPDGTPRDPGVVRLHYRAPTEAGSSGSPVFDKTWQVIAMHHAAGPAIPRLNGKPGTYATSEGIWIQSIARAVKGSSGARHQVEPTGTSALL